MSDLEIIVGGEPSLALDEELRLWPVPGGFESVAVPWCRLTAFANPGRVSLATVEVRRDGALVAVAMIHIVHGLAVGDYTGGALERVTHWGRRVGYTPFAFDVAYLELPFTNRSGVLFRPDLSESDRARILGELLDSLDGKSLAVDALCVKGEARDATSTRVLSARKLSRLPFNDNNVLTLPGSPPRFDRWLQERSAHRRGMIKRDIRDFGKHGVELEWASDPAPFAERIEELHARTAANAHKKGELPLPFGAKALFYRGFHAHLGDRGAVRLAKHNGDVIGFLVHVYAHDTLFVKFVGLDYQISQASRAYFRLFYDAIEEACRRGLRFVDMGSTTNHVKARLGCVTVTTQYHVQFRRRLRLAGLVLSRMLASRFGAPVTAPESA